ncbi:MAG: TolB family protein [Planctomycetota bacterium]
MRSTLPFLWMTFALTAHARAQTTQRVSVDSAGTQGNFTSQGAPVISADGRYIAFDSEAWNLVPGDTNFADDIFVHDLHTGATTRVSVSSAGAQTDRTSNDPALSSDGRFVAFDSSATNLVPNDTNGGADVFVHDRQSGQTTRVNVSSAGEQTNGGVRKPSISADGRYVAFASTSAQLVAGDTNGLSDVFVHDRETGATTRVSVATGGAQASGEAPSLSADGRHVAFESSSSSFGGTNIWRDVYVHDRETGRTTLVSRATWGGDANFPSESPAISADGRYVAFTSMASDLVVGDTNGLTDIFVRDLQKSKTTRVSVDSAGTQSDVSALTSHISADGRYVAFSSFATNHVPGDTNAAADAFVHDRATGRTTRVSVASSGAQSLLGTSTASSLSADGRRVVFWSIASDLVPSDTNGTVDVFVHDRGPERITPFCFGDGSAAACPCGNSGALRHGCASSIFARGGYLGGFGSAVVASDTLLLHAQEVSGTSTLFYQGDAQTAATLLDDGIGCVGGGLVRLGLKANASGTSSYPDAGDLSVSRKGLVGALGGTRYYQAWYRNVDPSFCTPATTNRTNGVIVAWGS